MLSFFVCLLILFGNSSLLKFHGVLWCVTVFIAKKSARPVSLKTQILKLCETSLIFFCLLYWPSWSDALIFVPFILYFLSLCPFALFSGRYSHILSFKSFTEVYTYVHPFPPHPQTSRALICFIASCCCSSFVNAVSSL